MAKKNGQKKEERKLKGWTVSVHMVGLGARLQKGEHKGGVYYVFVVNAAVENVVNQQMY